MDSKEYRLFHINSNNSALTILLICGGFAWLRIYGRQPVEIEDPETGETYQNLNLILGQAMYLLVALGINGSILISTLVSWNMIENNDLYQQLFILAPVGLWLLVSPILLLLFRRKHAHQTETQKTVSWDDDRYWKLGLYYFNRDDPSIMVNKRFGIGRTLNFGNPISWIVMGIILIILLIKIIR